MLYSFAGMSWDYVYDCLPDLFDYSFFIALMHLTLHPPALYIQIWITTTWWVLSLHPCLASDQEVLMAAF